MNSRFLPRILLVLAALPGAIEPASAQGGPSDKPGGGLTRADRVEATYRGGLVSPPLAKPDFALTDTSGARFDLRKQTQGFITLLFFGYANCPDMCPMQMLVVARALKATPPEVAKQFRVVFVTTDPDRDTPAALRAWLDHFDKSFIGLTGTQQEIDGAQIAANLAPAKKTPMLPNGGYAVGHAAFILAYTRDNLAHVLYPVGIKTQDWIHDLPYLAGETWTKP
jgi:protein SCO1/2